MVTVLPSMSAVTVSCGLTRGLSSANASDATKTERIRKLRLKYFIPEPVPASHRAPVKKRAQPLKLVILVAAKLQNENHFCSNSRDARWIGAGRSGRGR